MASRQTGHRLITFLIVDENNSVVTLIKKKKYLEHVNTVAALAVTADEELLITGCSGHLIKVPRYISTETRHVETHEDKLNLLNHNRRKNNG